MITKRINTVFTAILLVMLTVSCSSNDQGVIISAKDALTKISEGYKVVDAQKASSYAKEHLNGAVNIERAAINVKTPVPNSVAPADIISDVAGKAGLSESSNIVVYDDNNNMDAARLYWTLKGYGHTGDITIVSGGLEALKKAGGDINKNSVSVSSATYSASEKFDRKLITTTFKLESSINNPKKNFKVIDVRSDDEYNAGSIPGSIHINYEENLKKDGSFKSAKQILNLYNRNSIRTDDSIVVYCKSSIRAANTYAALTNAGFESIRVYDGAWLEWTAKEMPVFVPEQKTEKITVTTQDNS